jgi:hypothetical protein
MSNRKSVFARALLLFATALFLLQGGLGFWFVQFNAWEHKQEMQSENHENTLLLSFNNQELEQLNWEGDREFEFNGNMYDVVQSSTDEHGNTVFEVAQDNLEDELISFLDDLVNQNQSQKKQTSGFLSFVKTPCVTNEASIELTSFCTVVNFKPDMYYIGSVSTFVGTEIERPPLAA